VKQNHKIELKIRQKRKVFRGCYSTHTHAKALTHASIQVTTPDFLCSSSCKTPLLNFGSWWSKCYNSEVKVAVVVTTYNILSSKINANTLEQYPKITTNICISLLTW